MTFDPGTIAIAIVCIVVFVLVGSRVFPEDMRLNPWGYREPRDRPSPEVRDAEDAPFDWSRFERGDRGEPGEPHES